ncbi:MAG: helix-turn-helix transcriptional regulator [Cyclobacteriaceae bacterium]|nr:helix-turn-helix transcriptional regulator [Cyclobacteriaceae bacterium]
MSNARYNYVRVDNPEVPFYPVATPEAPHVQWVIPEGSGMSSDLGLVSLRDMYLPNFSARISEGKYNHDGLLENTAADGLDKVGFCLFLKGSFETEDQSQFNVRAYQGTQNFKFDPQNEFRHRIAAGMAFHLIHFAVSADFFMQFLPEHEAWADQLRERIQRGERIMGHHSPYITVAQDRALQVVLNPPMQGKLGALMVETAIQQIILLQMHSIFQQAEEAVPGLSAADRELIREVKEYLAHHFLDDHSLVSLSRHFGVNTNKLMALFKRLFGKSIFEFIGDLRMGYARERLLQDGHRVVDVARELGYRNANHFSTAFKKRFGVSPSQVR